jgi:hypothetical protein
MPRSKNHLAAGKQRPGGVDEHQAGPPAAMKSGHSLLKTSPGARAACVDSDPIRPYGAAIDAVGGVKDALRDALRNNRRGPRSNKQPSSSDGWRYQIANRPAKGDIIMDMTTLLIIVVVVLLIGGGGFYGRGRWY